MEDLKLVVASNISRLRKSKNMTQAELAERINYSDKSVSKWERAEALPDVAVLKSMAELFDVSVDFMLKTHDEWNVEPPKPTRSYSSSIITLVAVLGIWTVSVLLFVIFWLLGKQIWEIFLYTLPLSLTTLLVLNNVWKERRYNLAIISGLLFSIFLIVYGSLKVYNPWQIIFIFIPAELIVILSFKIKNRKKT